MLSRAYRHAAADQRRQARKAAVAGDVTGDKVIDDAASGWLLATTIVLGLTAALLALGCYQAVSHSARSIPLLVVAALFLAATVRSGAKLAVLRRRRRHQLSGHPRGGA